MRFPLSGISLAVLGWAVASAAFAQAGAAPRAAETPPQPAQDAATTVDEIVVTAQRRDERLQDVPISITAVTGERLERSGVRQTDDLSTIVPGLTITRNSNTTVPFLRGVGTFSTAPGQEASVPFYLDGVYVPQPTGLVFSLENVSRIEVLKGPQGTLFGRNASGGLINIVTADPGGANTGKLRIGYGSYDTLSGSFFGQLGLSDTLAASLNLFGSDRRYGFGTNIKTGAKVGEEQQYGGRAKFVFRPSDTLKAVFAIDYAALDGDAGLARGVLEGTRGTGGYQPAGLGYYDIDSEFEPSVTSEGWGTSLIVDQAFDHFSLGSLTGYRSVDSTYRIDQDAQPRTIANFTNTDLSKSFSQELQVKSLPDSDVAWIGGLYYFRYDSGYQPFRAEGIRSDYTDQVLNSYAAFGQVTYPLSEATHITGGLRYTRDYRTFASRSIVASRNIPEVKSDYGKYSWRIALDHKFTEDVLGYAVVSSGFKAGVYDSTSPRSTPVNPETVTAYEAGVKSEWFDHRLRLNGAAFYYDYSDIQIATAIAGGAVLQNAATATIYGGELEAFWRATAKLDFTLAASLTHSEFDDFPAAQFTTPAAAGGNTAGFRDVSGNRLTRTPPFTINAGVHHQADLAGGTLDSTLTYYHTDSFFWAPDNRLEQGAYDIVNADLTWGPNGAPWRVNVWGKNLTGSEYAQTLSSTTLGDVYSAAPPETYGVALTVEF